jgi:hypothetical protein
MTPNEKLELQVAEEDDGSATVLLPDGEENPQDDDINDDATENSGDNDEREQIRAARREERRLKKQIHREKARESNSLITSLRKQNETLAERLVILEKKTNGAELARVDKAIEDAGVQVEYAKMKLTEAVNLSNGSDAIDAQEMLYEAKRNVEALQNLKRQATQQASKPNTSQPNPMIAKLASEWMDDNPWYDPNGKNVESKIAITIDNVLTEEGYDPTTEDYWDELTERIQKYVPNVQNRVYNDSNRKQRPRSVVTSSGRESMSNSKGNEFVLSPERVSAIKESGKWDNMKERTNMINYYRNYDKQNKVRG